MGWWSALPKVAKAAGITAAGSLLGTAATGVNNAREAQKNRDFQERLSNTAYQRAATDMEAAGLNRILAIGSPATTPGGATAQWPDFGSSFAQGMSAGVQGVSSASDIALKKQQEIKTIQEQLNIGVKTAQEIVKTELWSEIGGIITEGLNNWNKENAESLETWLRANLQWIQAEAEGMGPSMELAWKEMFKSLTDKINKTKGLGNSPQTVIEINRGNDGVR